MVLGACYTGKTALIRVFAQNIYPEQYEPTIEDIFRRQYVTADGESCLLNIVDTCGYHNEHCAILEQMVRCGDAFLCAYSVDDIQSYELIENYLLKIHLIKPHAPVVLLCTKCDLLPEEWKVSPTMGRNLSARYGFTLVETSAKTGQGVEDSFSLLVGQLRRLKEIKTQEKESRQCCCSIC